MPDNKIKNALNAGQEMINAASPKFLPALNVASVVAGLAVNVVMLVAGLKSLNAMNDSSKDDAQTE